MQVAFINNITLQLKQVLTNFKINSKSEMFGPRVVFESNTTLFRVQIAFILLVNISTYQI